MQGLQASYGLKYINPWDKFRADNLLGTKPHMAMKTWSGSNGNWANASNWQGGLPKRGDEVVIRDGDPIATNLNLQGMDIELGTWSGASLTLIHSRIENLNVVYRGNLQIPDASEKSATINVFDHSTIGGASMFGSLPPAPLLDKPSFVTVNLNKDSILTNTGTIWARDGVTDISGSGTFQNNGLFIDDYDIVSVSSPITGNGKIEVGSGVDPNFDIYNNNIFGAPILRVAAVSSGEHIKLVNGSVYADDPMHFKATVDFSSPNLGGGLGLATASTAAEYKNNELTLFNGAQAVADFHVNVMPNMGLKVTSDDGLTYVRMVPSAAKNTYVDHPPVLAGFGHG